MSKCAAIKANGERCNARPIDGSEWCFNHDPAKAEERKRNGHKGGVRGGRGRPRVEITHVKVQLQDLADGVLDGSVSRADAAVASQILNVLLRAITVELQVKDQQEIVERLQALENALQERNTHRQANQAKPGT